jgi:DNA-binding MarR family transcriptional regulator
VSVAVPADRALLAERLRLVVTRLGRRLRQQAESGLSPSAMSALSAIARHGPLWLGELAVHEGVRPPSITATVAGLEAQGLVARTADPADRRVSRVAPTARGRARLQRARGRKAAYLAGRLAELSEDDLRLLEGAAGILERLLAGAEGER